MKVLLLLILIPPLVGGCATTRDSMLLGAGMGAAVGGGMGNMATDHSPKGTAIGALTGAAFGALLGFLGRKGREDKEKFRSTMESDFEKSKPPRLSAPRYHSIWVPATIDGDRYTEGHRVFIIEEPGKWTTD